MNRETIVANVTAVAIGGRALVLEGPPGSGKSSLALALVDRGAILIGDDGITLRHCGNHLTASPPPKIAGKIEVRGVGIVALPQTATAPLALVLALRPGTPRYPFALEQRDYLGLGVPCLPFTAGDAVQALRAEFALENHGLRFSEAPEGSKVRDHG